MSCFGRTMVAMALSAGLAAPVSRVQAQDAAASKSIQTAPSIPWFDPSLANNPDRARMLAISVAAVRGCSASSTAVCYGFCAPIPDKANGQPLASRKSAPINRQTPINSKPTNADEAATRNPENRATEN